MGIGIGLGALSALGSVASNLMSNSQNVQLAREQREWDARMIAQQNQYNSPAAQKARLRAAGMNPAIAMMNGMMDTGNQSQSAGGQSPAQVDYNPLAEGLRSAGELYNQSRLNDAEIRYKDSMTEAQRIRNKTQLLRDLAELNNTISQTGVNAAHKEYLVKQRDYLMKQIDAFDERNAAEVGRIEQERKLLSEQEVTERVMRGVNEQLVQANIRLSKSQAASFAAQTKATLESVNQMILNGVSQRQINSFISDREREIARQYRLENDNWYTSYRTRIAKERSETQRNQREHRTESIKFFGIPLGTTEKISQYDEYGNLKPSPLW